MQPELHMPPWDTNAFCVASTVNSYGGVAAVFYPKGYRQINYDENNWIHETGDPTGPCVVVTVTWDNHQAVMTETFELKKGKKRVADQEWVSTFLEWAGWLDSQEHE